ncbi:DUF2188 domain-containing protein [Kocuria rosea]|uniref:DUF2188 domain-containing protein n=1 Tax=Kocuria rosea TaxID=1275 RepID=UPI001FD1CD0B|nr:DUF2188 domain-containing protein [Kocuria rosea]
MLALRYDKLVSRTSQEERGNMPNYDVYKKNDKWVGKRDDASRASVARDTQADAYAATRDIAARNGGGEINLHGVDGTIRDKNTIAPAKDPRSSKG